MNRSLCPTPRELHHPLPTPVNLSTYLLNYELVNVEPIMLLAICLLFLCCKHVALTPSDLFKGFKNCNLRAQTGADLSTHSNDFKATTSVQKQYQIPVTYVFRTRGEGKARKRKRNGVSDWTPTV